MEFRDAMDVEGYWSRWKIGTSGMDSRKCLSFLRLKILEWHVYNEIIILHLGKHFDS